MASLKQFYTLGLKVDEIDMSKNTKSCNIMVSVFCLAYNHQNYIREALEGFLMQKTNFAFEVLIHEDASTDGTAQILREYEKKYPGFIRVVYEEENRYGQGVEYFYDILAPMARGKYIAVCEGDDAWIDENKLQIQVDYMEKHPECSLLGHKAFLQYPYNWNGDRDPRAMGVDLDGMVVPYERMFFEWQIPTASFVFRKDTYMEMPQFFRNAPTGDEPLEFYLAEKGEVHFMDRVMSVYNKMSSDSFSAKILENPYSKMVKYYTGYITLFDEMDKYTNYTKHEFFNNCIKERIRRAAIYIFSNSRSYEEAGDMLKQLADSACCDWQTYILEQQSSRFSFWNRNSSYWDCIKGKKIYVYGAGRLATKFLKEVLPVGTEVQSIIVSKDTGKRELCGIKLIALSEYINEAENNSLIIIAVNDEFAQEIIGTLRANQINNYIWVYESVYKSINDDMFRKGNM